jgi:hypothetical protein
VAARFGGAAFVPGQVEGMRGAKRDGSGAVAGGFGPFERFGGE